MPDNEVTREEMEEVLEEVHRDFSKWGLTDRMRITQAILERIREGDALPIEEIAEYLEEIQQDIDNVVHKNRSAKSAQATIMISIEQIKALFLTQSIRDFKTKPTPQSEKPDRREGPPEGPEEKVWDILFDAREVLEANRDEGWQDALSDIARRIVRLQKQRPRVSREDVDGWAESWSRDYGDGMFSHEEAVANYATNIRNILTEAGVEVIEWGPF